MIAPPVIYPNDGAARSVRRRQPLQALPLGLLIWTVGLALTNLLGGAITLSLALQLLALSIGLMFAFAYTLEARLVIFVNVPVSIHIGWDGRSIVGDFRRAGWVGESFQRIPFDEVAYIGKSRYLRIPVVLGRPDPHRRGRLRIGPKFYLTESNLQTVRRAMAGTLPTQPIEAGWRSERHDVGTQK